MKKVLILHGWGGSDEPHWQWWVAKELKKLNYEISFPNLPNRDAPNLDVWMDTLKKEFDRFQPDIVMCHSLANILWFNFVTKYEIKELDKLMLVAPVRQECDIEEIKTFFPYPIPTDLRAKESIMVGSTNDEYLDFDEALQLQSALNVGLKILKDAGHINAESGFGELRCAVDWIEREIE
jgi:predicted alpha/beta hydrolase family esterase